MNEKELKLSSGKVVSENDIRIAKKIYHYNTFSKFLTIFSLLSLVLAGVYFCFAITIIRVLPFSNMGMVPVKNLTTVGGIAPKGKILYVNVNNSEGDGYLDRAKQAFIPNSNVAKVSVITGPFGAIAKESKNSIKVNDKTIDNLENPIGTKKYLNNEYVVKCLQGNCMVGENFIAPSDNIYGEPLEKVK